MDIHPLHREAPGHVPVLKLVPIHTQTRNQSSVLDLAVSLHLLRGNQGEKKLFRRRGSSWYHPLLSTGRTNTDNVLIQKSTNCFVTKTVDATIHNPLLATPPGDAHIRSLHEYIMISIRDDPLQHITIMIFIAHQYHLGNGNPFRHHLIPGIEVGRGMERFQNHLRTDLLLDTLRCPRSTVIDTDIWTVHHIKCGRDTLRNTTIR